MTTLYLIRHGTTDSNLSGVFQGCMDTPLNQRGLAQAEYLARHMATLGLDFLYASGLQRAQQTAEAIARATGLTFESNALFNEINLGEFEGKSAQENAKTHPEAIEQLNRDTWNFQAPGGESTQQVYRRAVEGIQGVVAAHPGKTLAVVSHGFTIQTYLNHVWGKLPGEFSRLIVGNTAISKFIFAPGHLPQLEYFNDQSHLPQELRFDLAPEE